MWLLQPCDVLLRLEEQGCGRLQAAPNHTPAKRGGRCTVVFVGLILTMVYAAANGTVSQCVVCVRVLVLSVLFSVCVFVRRVLTAHTSSMLPTWCHSVL